MMAEKRKLTWRGIKAALWRTVDDVTRKHTLQMAAALSYYFVLALFPGIVFLSAVVAYLPINDLLNQVMNLFGAFVPPDSMQLVRNFVNNVVVPNRGTLLSFGILGTLWSASGGFASAIEALNIAYEVEEARPFWVTRPLAIGLTFLVGVLLLVAFGVMVLGPEFGQNLAERIKLSWLFAVAWPYIHWTISFAFTVLAVFCQWQAGSLSRTFSAFISAISLTSARPTVPSGRWLL
jgi:membrane protein